MKFISIMIRCFLIGLCNLSFAQKPVYIVPDSVFCWDENIKLQWKDFKGRPDTSSVYGAATDSYIDVVPYYNEKLRNTTYKVIHRFIKSTSWSKDTSSWYALYLLRHEQLHFDISELCARKIRYEIFKLDSANYTVAENATIYLETIDKLLADKMKKNKLYDEETGHGLKNIKQQEWLVKVHSELNKLKKYATTIQDCGILTDEDE